MVKKEPLKEWAKHYFLQRDLMLKRISSIKDDRPLEFTIEYKDNTLHKIFAIPVLDKEEFWIKEIERYKKATLVAYNTKQNLDYVIKNYERLNISRSFSIIFVNPLSDEMKWSFFPATHKLVSEKASLKRGLLSLAGGVGFISPSELKKLGL